MQLRSQLVLYSVICCALGILLSFGIARFYPLAANALTTPRSFVEATVEPTPTVAVDQHSQTLPAKVEATIDIKAVEVKTEVDVNSTIETLPKTENSVKATTSSASSEAAKATVNNINLPISVELVILLFSCSVCALGALWLTRYLGRSLDALEIGLLNFKDNDFSVNIPEQGEGQLYALAQLFNHSAQKLRKERQYIYQRELLLDKVIQSSPNVMLLLDGVQNVIYANDAARHLFQQKGRMEGLSLAALLPALPVQLAQVLSLEQNGLFAVGEEDVETWHVSRGHFLLNNQQHHLILLKQMTRELNRQEVAVWKKVIRIISHELNNSVAPIASMVNSGRILTRDIDNPKLQLIFDTIENRTTHLSQFIFNYARFAKLPLPQLTEVQWPQFIEQLTQHYPFNVRGDLPEKQGLFDQGQLEQVLLNLLKNAHESGSEPQAVSLTIRHQRLADGAGFSIEVADRGSGMSSEVLDQALLPFYSTKQSGTGLGLPLCREIIEAHSGRIHLRNRTDGGLCVRLWLPQG